MVILMIALKWSRRRWRCSRIGRVGVGRDGEEAYEFQGSAESLANAACSGQFGSSQLCYTRAHLANTLLVEGLDLQTSKQTTWRVVFFPFPLPSGYKYSMAPSASMSFIKVKTLFCL